MERNVFICIILSVCIITTASSSSKKSHEKAKETTSQSTTTITSDVLTTSKTTFDADSTAEALNGTISMRSSRKRLKERRYVPSYPSAQYPPAATSDYCPPLASACPSCISYSSQLPEDVCSYPVVIKVLMLSPPTTDVYGKVCGKFGLLSGVANTDIKQYRRLLRFSVPESCGCILEASSQYILISKPSAFLKDGSLHTKISLSNDVVMLPVDRYTEAVTLKPLEQCNLKPQPDAYGPQSSEYIDQPIQPRNSRDKMTPPQKPYAPDLYFTPQPPYQTPNPDPYVQPYAPPPTFYVPPYPPMSYPIAGPITYRLPSFLPEFTNCFQEQSCPKCLQPGEVNLEQEYCTSDFAYIALVRLPDLTKVKGDYSNSYDAGSCLNIRTTVLHDVSKSADAKLLNIQLNSLLPKQCSCFPQLKGFAIVLLLGHYTNTPIYQASPQLGKEFTLVYLPSPSEISVPNCVSYPAPTPYVPPVQDLQAYPVPNCPYGFETSCPSCSALADQIFIDQFCAAKFALVAELQGSGSYAVLAPKIPSVQITTSEDQYNYKSILIKVMKSSPPSCIEGSLKILQVVKPPQDFYTLPSIVGFTILSECLLECPLLTAPGTKLLLYSSKDTMFLPNGIIQLTDGLYVAALGVYDSLPSCPEQYIFPEPNVPDHVSYATPSPAVLPDYPTVYSVVASMVVNPDTPSNSIYEAEYPAVYSKDYTDTPPSYVVSPPPYVVSPPPYVASPPPYVASPPPYVASPPPASPPPYVASPPPYTTPPPLPYKSFPPYKAEPPPYKTDPPPYVTAAPLQYKTDPPPYVTAAPLLYKTEPPPYVSAAPPSYKTEPPSYVRVAPSSYKTEPPSYVSAAPPSYKTEPPPYVSAAPPSYKTEPPSYVSAAPPSYKTEPSPYVSVAPPAYKTDPPYVTAAPPLYKTKPPPYVTAAPPPPQPLPTKAPPPPYVDPPSLPYTAPPPPPPPKSPYPVPSPPPYSTAPPPPPYTAATTPPYKAVPKVPIEVAPPPYAPVPSPPPVIPPKAAVPLSSPYAIPEYKPCLENDFSCPECSHSLPLNFRDAYCTANTAILIASGLNYNTYAEYEDAMQLTFKPLGPYHINIQSGVYGPGLDVTVSPFTPWDAIAKQNAAANQLCFKDTIRALYDVTRGYQPPKKLSLDIDVYMPALCQDCPIFLQSPTYGIILSKNPLYLDGPIQLTNQFSYYPLPKAVFSLPDCYSEPEYSPASVYRVTSVDKYQVPAYPTGKQLTCDYPPVCTKCPDPPPYPYFEIPCDQKLALVVEILETSTGKPGAPTLEVTVYQKHIDYYDTYVIALNIQDSPPAPDTSGPYKNANSCKYAKVKVIQDLSPYPVLPPGTILTVLAAPDCDCNIFSISQGFGILLAPEYSGTTITIGPASAITLPFGYSSISLCSEAPPAYQPPAPSAYPPPVAPAYPSPVAPAYPPPVAPPYPPPVAPTYPPPAAPTYPPPAPSTDPPYVPPIAKPPLPPPAKVDVNYGLHSGEPPAPSTNPPYVPPVETATTPPPAQFDVNYGLQFGPAPPLPCNENAQCSTCGNSVALNENPDVYCDSLIVFLVRISKVEKDKDGKCASGAAISMYEITASKPAQKAVLNIFFTLPHKCVCPQLDVDKFALLMIHKSIPITNPLVLNLDSSFHLYSVPKGRLTLPFCAISQFVPRTRDLGEIFVDPVDNELTLLRRKELDLEKCPTNEHSCPKCDYMGTDDLKKLICSSDFAFEVTVNSKPDQRPRRHERNERISVSQHPAKNFSIDIVVKPYEGPDTCNSPVIEGNCNSELEKFYYDADDQECKEFVYTGCNGNANNFNSYIECEESCMTEGYCDEGSLDVQNNPRNKYSESWNEKELRYYVGEDCDCPSLIPDPYCKYLVYNSTGFKDKQAVHLGKNFYFIPLTDSQRGAAITCDTITQTDVNSIKADDTTTHKSQLDYNDRINFVTDFNSDLTTYSEDSTENDPDNSKLEEISSDGKKSDGDNGLFNEDEDEPDDLTTDDDYFTTATNETMIKKRSWFGR